MINISKIGSEHIGANRNNQDYFFVSEDGKVKVVMDGCGSGEFSEIGTRLFHLVLRERGEITLKNFEEVVKDFFKKFKAAIELTFKDVTNVLYNISTFTILAAFEEEDHFTVLTCGDGYIITQDIAGMLLFHETKEVIKDGGEEYPKYFVYNYVGKDRLKFYKDEVTFTKHVYPKGKYVNVGVATDGLRFWSNLSYDDGNKFIELLKNGKKGPLSRFITKVNEKYVKENGEIRENVPVFRDDISIVF